MDCDMFLKHEKTCDRIVTELSDIESGLLCFDKVSVCRERFYAF